jgi:hypothetical protein
MFDDCDGQIRTTVDESDPRTVIDESGERSGLSDRFRPTPTNRISRWAANSLVGKLMLVGISDSHQNQLRYLDERTEITEGGKAYNGYASNQANKSQIQGSSRPMRRVIQMMPLSLSVQSESSSSLCVIWSSWRASRAMGDPCSQHHFVLKQQIVCDIPNSPGIS